MKSNWNSETRDMRNGWPASRGLPGAPCVLAAALLALLPLCLAQGKSKNAPAQPTQAAQPQHSKADELDTSKLVWPQPPDVARIRWLAQYQGEPPKPRGPGQAKKKQSWMDRLAGVQPESVAIKNRRFKLVQPNGVAVDQAGNIYVADSYVGAVFMFRPGSKQVNMISNGADARFRGIIGLAMDSGGRLFVVDVKARQVLAFDASHKLEKEFGYDRLAQPTGAAVDDENRFLYVVDAAKECVFVFDADNFRYLRTVGGPAKKEGAEDQGTFSRPTAVAVDKEGNLYVSDTMNNRVQIFDADGNFISMFGKHGDKPGYFARPKGISVDADGHIWVVDSQMEAVQIYDREGTLLGFVGGHGELPGRFNVPSGITIDSRNQVYVTEEFFNGRVQVFQYITDAEAAAEKAAPTAITENGAPSGAATAQNAGTR
jgi:DNA-binding beta-propeller fold protein YncE